MVLVTNVSLSAVLLLPQSYLSSNVNPDKARYYSIQGIYSYLVSIYLTLVECGKYRLISYQHTLGTAAGLESQAMRATVRLLDYDTSRSIK